MIDARVHTIGRLHAFQLPEKLPRVMKTAKKVLDRCRREGGNTLAVAQKYQKKKPSSSKCR